MKSTIFLNQQKKLVLLAISVSAIALSLTFQNCSKQNFTQTSVAGFSKPIVVEQLSQCQQIIRDNDLKDCSKPVVLKDGTTMDRKEWEREQALAAVAADPKLIPVQYAYSFGQKEDILAQAAHDRAILSKSRALFKDSNGKDYSPITVSSKTSSAIVGVYQADHSLAKAQYISGERCYYSTVKTNADVVADSVYIDKVPATHASITGGVQHMVRYMIHGWCDPGAGSNCATSKSRYGVGNYGNDVYPNRLFDKIPHKEVYFENGVSTGKSEAQFVKLYVADIRDGQFGLSTTTSKIVKVNELAQRGNESTMAVDDFIDLATILTNFSIASDSVAKDFVSQSTQLKFSGLEGSKQLLANLCAASLSASALATQYTPVVLDLGEPQIRTSGIGDGVTFNMSGVAGEKVKTAWVGGFVRTEKAVSTAGVSFNRVLPPAAEDGFLVLPNSDGSITDAKNLFGNKTPIFGKTYSNGFEALMILGNKNCRSADIKSRYIGPWDGALYESQLKVWIDKNRNGISEAGEVISLREAGVAAINTCYSNKYGSKDAYGNETAVQSLMIYQKPLIATEQDILDILTPKRSATSTSIGLSRRLAIDILFKAEDGK